MPASTEFTTTEPQPPPTHIAIAELTQPYLNGTSQPLQHTPPPFSPSSLPPTTARALVGRLPPNFIRHQIIHFIFTIILDVVIPVILYFILGRFIESWLALLIGSVPALAVLVVKGLWKRTLDIIAFTVFAAFAISAIVAVTTRNGRILIFEKSLVTVIIGIVFALTIAPFTIPRPWRKDKTSLHVKPILLPIVKQLIPLGNMNKQTTGGVEISRWDWMYDTIPSFRKQTRVLTALWALGLIAEFLGRLIMFLSPMTLDQVVLWANVYFGVVLVLLVIITGLYVFWVKGKIMNDVDEWLVKESGVVGVRGETEQSMANGGHLKGEVGKPNYGFAGEVEGNGSAGQLFAGKELVESV